MDSTVLPEGIATYLDNIPFYDLKEKAKPYKKNVHRSYIPFIRSQKQQEFRLKQPQRSTNNSSFYEKKTNLKIQTTSFLNRQWSNQDAWLSMNTLQQKSKKKRPEITLPKHFVSLPASNTWRARMKEGIQMPSQRSLWRRSTKQDLSRDWSKESATPMDLEAEEIIIPHEVSEETKEDSETTLTATLAPVFREENKVAPHSHNSPSNAIPRTKSLNKESRLHKQKNEK